MQDDVLPDLLVTLGGDVVALPEGLNRQRTLLILDLEPGADSPGYVRDWDQVLTSFDNTGPFDQWLVTPIAAGRVSSWSGRIVSPVGTVSTWKAILDLADGEGRGAMVLDQAGTILTKISGGPGSVAIDWVRTAIAGQPRG